MVETPTEQTHGGSTFRRLRRQASGTCHWCFLDEMQIPQLFARPHDRSFFSKHLTASWRRRLEQRSEAGDARILQIQDARC